MHENTVTHEVLHALGFNHEQNRYYMSNIFSYFDTFLFKYFNVLIIVLFVRKDRDDYVKIKFENIEAGMQGNFRKRIKATPYMSYDYHSIMHYNFTDFSKNGKNTIGEFSWKMTNYLPFYN